MVLPKELTTVTPLSKAVALIMFITLPIIGFFFGAYYQLLITQTNPIVTTSAIRPTPIRRGCTLEAKLCPDGTAVGRSGPNCEFAECPVITPKAAIFCGGIAGKTCPAGLQCKLDGTYPDAGGTCVTENATKFVCPNQEFVNCMPSPDRQMGAQCSKEFLQWAKENCPNFKGAAL